MSDPLNTDTSVPGATHDFGAAYEAIDKHGRDVLAHEQGELQPAIGAAQRTLAAPRPAAPTPEKVPAAPKNNPGEIANGWLQANILLSSLASVFARQHSTAALQAFSAGIKGWKEGNSYAADQAYKQWKSNSDAVVQNNQSMMEGYKTVLEDRKLGLEEQMQQISLIASKYKDQLTYQAAAARNFTLVAHIIDSQQQATNDFALRTKELDQAHADRVENQRIELAKIQANGKIPNLNTPVGIKQFTTWYATLPADQKAHVDHVMGMLHPGTNLQALMSTPGGGTPAAPAAPAKALPTARGNGNGDSPANAAALPATGEPAAGKWYNTEKGVGKYQGGGFFTTLDEELGPDQQGKTLPLPPQ